jgi:S-formylglutathione hydrolase FrmB
VVETTSFYSPSLGEVRELNVYLPEGYDPDGATLYPVIYFLHGYTGDHFYYLPVLIDNVDNMIANKAMHPTILVMPNANTKSGLGIYGTWYVNSELFGNYEDYIVNDIVDFIDTNYRTFPSREKRSISGHSMGGFGCTELAFKYPHLFKGVASFSGIIGFWSFFDPWWIYGLIMEADPNGYGPPYNWDPSLGFSNYGVFVMCGAFAPNLNNPPYYVDFILDPYANMIPSVVAKWDAHNPPTLAYSLPEYPKLSIYFDCGTYDEFANHAGNVELSMTLDSLGIPHDFQSFEGDHNTFLIERIPIGFTFLDGAMNQQGAGSGPVVYVKNQGLYYDSVLATGEMPSIKKFRVIETGGPHGGLQVEYGPGDPEYKGGLWKEDFNGTGTYHGFCCPLVGPGRTDPWN